MKSALVVLRLGSYSATQIKQIEYLQVPPLNKQTQEQGITWPTQYVARQLDGWCSSLSMIFGVVIFGRGCVEPA